MTNAVRRVSIASIDIRSEDIDSVARVLASGNLRQGAVTERFEASFAERVQAKHAVAVSSGTAALHLAYLTLFSPGDHVILPSFTFVATASMLLAVGATPVFADVDPNTFTVSPTDIEARITERTRGIVGVHLFGNSCDIDAVANVARKHDLVTVWDAAQALGTEYRGHDVGSRGSAVTYSFYPSKNITTGEGGMVVTDDAHLAAAIRLARSHGATEKYVHSSMGFNYRMTDFQAALGIEQLRRVDSYLDARRANAAFLTRHLRQHNGIRTPTVPPYSRHSFNQYSVLIDQEQVGLTRDDVAARLGERGVETSVHYPRPIHRQPLFRDSTTHLPHSDELAERILSLPVHPALSVADLRHIVKAVKVVAGR